ncbi:MAG: hypothetical protein C4338_07410 [Rhodanobacteraceae bacterium]
MRAGALAVVVVVHREQHPVMAVGARERLQRSTAVGAQPRWHRVSGLLEIVERLQSGFSTMPRPISACGAKSECEAANSASIIRFAVPWGVDAIRTVACLMMRKAPSTTALPQPAQTIILCSFSRRITKDT